MFLLSGPKGIFHTSQYFSEYPCFSCHYQRLKTNLIVKTNFAKRYPNCLQQKKGILDPGCSITLSPTPQLLTTTLPHLFISHNQYNDAKHDPTQPINRRTPGAQGDYSGCVGGGGWGCRGTTGQILPQKKHHQHCQWCAAYYLRFIPPLPQLLIYLLPDPSSDYLPGLYISSQP